MSVLRLGARTMATASSSHAFGAMIPPMHLAIPVHNLDLARQFYGGLMGCDEGRSSKTWIDWNFYGHQLVTHWANNEYRGAKYVNGVDADMVPVPHFGVCMTVPDFQALAAKFVSANVKFVLEPKLRFTGAPGEQWTMFLEDPSGNSLEFKALTTPDNLFAKYYVPETKH